MQLTTPYRPTVHGFRFGNRFRHQVFLGLSTWGRCNGIAQVSLDYFHAGRAAPSFEEVKYDVLPISGLGAASWASDRIDLFVRRDGDRIATKHGDGRSFSDWRDLTSSETDFSPAAASWGPTGILRCRRRTVLVFSRHRRAVFEPRRGIRPRHEQRTVVPLLRRRLAPLGVTRETARAGANV